MYMREMGTVELLTRQGEIDIAKRIEEGIKHVLVALGRYPDVFASLLSNMMISRSVKNASVKLSQVSLTIISNPLF